MLASPDVLASGVPNLLPEGARDLLDKGVAPSNGVISSQKGVVSHTNDAVSPKNPPTASNKIAQKQVQPSPGSRQTLPSDATLMNKINEINMLLKSPNSADSPNNAG